MGAMVGFVLGYMLGAKEGPEGLERLRRSWAAVSESDEFKSLIGGAQDTVMHYGSAILEKMQGAQGDAAKDAKDDSWASDNPADHRAGAGGMGGGSMLSLLGTLLDKGKELLAQHTGGGEPDKEHKEHKA